MSGLYSSLNSTVRAITAHSRAIETTGKNLANVNNPEYARQRVIYGDRGTVITADGAMSLGLEALGVEQIRDAMLDRQMLREIAMRSAYESEQSAYQRAQAGLGQSIDRATSADASAANNKGIAAALDDFFNAFQAFAARPTDIGERQSVLQKTQVLTDRFRMADERLDQVQADLDAEIASDVESVNRLLATIADIDSQIGRFEINAPGSAVDLRDERQARLEELAAILPIDVGTITGGRMEIVAKDGTGADVVLINLSTVQGTVAFDGTNITAGVPPTVLSLNGGSIQGALAARNGAVQTLRDDLDALAEQLVTEVNAAYNGNFFNPAGVTAGTIALDGAVTAVNLKASDGGEAGENQVALAIAGLATDVFSTAGTDQIDGTFSGFYAKAVSRIGQALSTANAQVEDQGSIERLIRTQRDAVSAVSLDEEMADLMKYQRAFQASSRVFSVVDDLLDTVVNRLGVG